MLTEHILLFSISPTSVDILNKMLFALPTGIITVIVNEKIDYDNSFISTLIDRIMYTMFSVVVHGVICLSLYSYLKASLSNTDDINFCLSLYIYLMILAIIIDILYISLLKKKLDIISFPESQFKNKYVLISKNKTFFKFMEIENYINQYHKKKNDILDHKNYLYTNINNINNFEKNIFYILSAGKKKEHFKTMRGMYIWFPIIMILTLISEGILFGNMSYGAYYVFCVFLTILLLRSCYVFWKHNKNRETLKEKMNYIFLGRK